MLTAIISAALRFRLLVAGVAIGLLLLGALSLRRMHADAVPELASGPVLQVQTEALGLSSEEVEQYVTVPLEHNLLDGIMGVWDVRSHSVPGLSAVDLFFEPGTSVAHARLLVQERLTRAFALPHVARPPQLMQPVSSSGRVMVIGLSSRTIDPLQLSYLARWIVSPKLSGVPGVANISIFHQQDRQLEVQVDPERLAARHVTLNQIVRTAGNAQLVSPLSYLEGAAPGTGGFLDQPNQRLDIRPVLPLGTPRDLATVPIADAPGHTPLGAAATTVQNHQPLIGDAVVNGGDGLALMVQKLPAASTLAVTKGIERALDDLRPALRGVRIDTQLFRPASYVAAAGDHLALGLAIACVLALLALVALLLDARLAFIGLLSTALSVITAMLVLQALGYTFNPIVALGLLIASAVVLDDALTALRALGQRLRAEGLDPRRDPIQRRILDACIELRSTLGYATLIVLGSVVPAFFATGASARLVHPMLLAFALAVIASMLVTLTFIPAAGMLLFDRAHPRRGALAISRRAATAYESLLSRALGVPRAALLGLCVIGLAGALSLAVVDKPSPPALRDRNLVVQWSGPPGTSLREMTRITRRVVGELRKLPSVTDAGATLGRALAGDQLADVNSGQLLVAVKPDADYQRAVAAVKAVVGRTPGMHASVHTSESAVTADAAAPSKDDVVVRIYGQDYGRLAALARRISGVMTQVSGVGRPHFQLPRRQPGMRIAVNDAAALRAGVLPGDARRAASTLVSGLTVGNFFQQQAVFDVVVRGTPAVRSDPQGVRNLLLDTSGGRHVRLRNIARVGLETAPVDIEHQALSRYVDVAAPVSGRSADSAATAVHRRLATVGFPLEYHAEVLGSTPEDATSHAAFLSYLAAVVVGVLLLLQAAFASWRLALLVTLMLPLTLAGGVIVGFALGKQASLGMVAGLLGVFAVAARHGMLLVAGVRREHSSDGGTLSRALVVRAASTGLATTAGGTLAIAALLLPFVVMGDVAGNELTGVAAAVMLGGLASAALANLLALPSLCLAFGPAQPAMLEDESESERLGPYRRVHPGRRATDAPPV